MVFIIGYIIVTALVFYCIYFFLTKKWQKLKIKNPLIITIINFILVSIFFMLFLSNPKSFSSESAISNKVVYFLFTIFATYFYMLIIPISSLNIIVSIKENLYDRKLKKFLTLMFSVLNIIIISYISIKIF